MYNTDDVELVWGNGKYLKNRGIPGIDIYPTLNLTYTEKKIIAVVSDVTLHQKELRYFKFRFRCAYRYEPDERTLPEQELRNYWGEYTQGCANLIRNYRPAIEFSSIHMLQKCSTQPERLNYRGTFSRTPDEVSSKPRLALKPRYGADYVYNVDHSIPIHHIIKWTPIIDVVYSNIRAQFFKDGVLD